MVNRRKCLCCGKQYDFCPSCSRRDALLPAWHATFCCDECKTLWETATKYNLNKVTKDEAMQIISALNLKDKTEYVACIQRDLNNIFKEETKQKPKRVKKSQVQVEMVEQNEETQLPVESTVHAVVIESDKAL